MGGARIDVGKSVLFDFDGEKLITVGEYNTPIDLYLKNKERFTRTNLSEIEGAGSNCLTSGVLLGNDLDLKSKLECLRDPFPLH